MIPRKLRPQGVCIPRPEIDWERLPLHVTATPTDWPVADDRPPRAGVSGFGWSGTNAHVVLEGYAPPTVADGQGPDRWIAGPPRPISVSRSVSVAGKTPATETLAPRYARFLPLSGKSDVGLREYAARYLAWLDEQQAVLSADGAASGPLLSDMAWTAATGRSHFGHRAGVVFHDEGSLRAGLTALAEGDAQPERRTAAKVAFAYTGQASQWPGMGEAL